MTTIRLRFSTGRYHATSWGRHVNEGVPEWPPSPYRLLRAIYDVWQRKCFEFPPANVQYVIEALARKAPMFAVPSATSTHTRSYLNSNEPDPTKKKLVFDSFLVFQSDQSCYMRWPDLELSNHERNLLSTLLANLNYLGRSESWIEAQLWERDMTSSHYCYENTEANASGNLVRVACAVPPSEYSGQSSWMEALTFSTSQLLKQRVDLPPVLRYVTYALPESAVLTTPPHRINRRPQYINAVLLSLDAAVLPLVTSTLELAEQVRVRLMGAHKREMDNDPSAVSPLFSGKTREGGKRLDHGHIYILPLGDGMGRIDRVLIISPLRAFTADELSAVRRIRELYQRDGRGEIQCVLTWQGQRKNFPGQSSSEIVQSVTPFVPPRHWRKGRNFEEFLIEEVRRECRNHRISSAVSVERTQVIKGLFHLAEYRRNRKNDPVRPGYSLRLTFAEKVVSPFSIGYGAHFGLGQFNPLKA